MKILIDHIAESPKTIDFTERVEELNQVCTERAHAEFRFPPAVDVNIVFYRSGREVLLHGSFRGVIEGHCSRCLEVYSFAVEKKFDLVLLPNPAETDKKRALNQEEMGISFYQGAEINLAPLIQEQVLLTLPIRPLCTEQCRGLCAGCGANLNEASCLCASPKADERAAPFRSLRINR
ncbi:MAG: YceD family protein [Candidatus Binatia bacterium]